MMLQLGVSSCEELRAGLGSKIKGKQLAVAVPVRVPGLGLIRFEGSHCSFAAPRCKNRLFPGSGEAAHVDKPHVFLSLGYFNTFLTWVDKGPHILAFFTFQKGFKSRTTQPRV